VCVCVCVCVCCVLLFFIHVHVHVHIMQVKLIPPKPHARPHARTHVRPHVKASCTLEQTSREHTYVHRHYSHLYVHPLITHLSAPDRTSPCCPQSNCSPLHGNGRRCAATSCASHLLFAPCVKSNPKFFQLFAFIHNGSYQRPQPLVQISVKSTERFLGRRR
jgi:hypothetical protein